jgi:hypothetical protein
LDRRRSTSAGMGKAVFHAHAHLEVKRWRVRETAACCKANASGRTLTLFRQSGTILAMGSGHDVLRA